MSPRSTWRVKRYWPGWALRAIVFHEIYCVPRNLTISHMPPRINLEGEKTPARVDDEGRAIKEADGTVAMREAQPMEYSNGVCVLYLFNMSGKS